MSLFGLHTVSEDHPLVVVAVERAVDRSPDGLTYALPPKLAHLPEGARVEVPLGRGETPTAGWIVERLPPGETNGIPRDKLKHVLAQDESGVVLPGELVQFARWMSGYYACPIGMTLASILPAAVRKAIGRVERTLLDLAPALVDASADPAARAALPKITKRQQHALDVLAKLPRPIEIGDLARESGYSSNEPLKRLIASGHLVAVRKTSVEAGFIARAGSQAPAPQPTIEQKAAIDAISRDLGSFKQHLIFGVTGAGKTEVYIRVIERCLATGKKAILLVPEISLTPQTVGRIAGRLANAKVAVLHSGLTEAQRNQQWTLLAEGGADVVVGARSAIFAPIPDGTLGLVVVDEEHEPGYKQDSAPRYHGRDAAIRRAQLAKCPVVLGSATPSLESWMNAVERKISTLHRLTKRAPGLNVPKVAVVDFGAERRMLNDRRQHLIGPTLRAAMEQTLSDGGQVLLLLNRRGYANYIACSDQRCDWILTCTECDAGMVCHVDGAGDLRRRYVRCHHCLAEQILPQKCPDCGKPVTVFGLGTQRVEEELTRAIPSLVEGKTLLRVDGDTMQTAAHFHDALERFGRGEVRVLMGTQMIAKGLDFPNVRLVGVVSADTALALPDFRAAERTFQLVSQVSGRAGRGEKPGRAIIQSFEPDTPAIRLAASHDFERFARQELEDRKHFGLPPYRRLARLILRHPGETECANRAAALADALRSFSGVVEVRGPSVCPISRIAGKYRRQIELVADSPVEISRVLAEARSRGLLKLGEELAVDVDPISAV
ncbi:MAG: primosomal protein N' [Planctomycetaceae bacterium]|nr:primosomal protein N' [Planctomycetaceae bacterium]